MESEDNRLRMAAIAGATHALKYIKKNRYATHDEAIGDVARNAKEILDML